MGELDYKRQLNSERRVSAAKEGKEIGKMAGKIIASPNKPFAVASVAASLLKHMNLFNDWLFAIAMIVAVLKDLLDYVGIGSLPAIGTVVTLCASILIGFIILLAGGGGKKQMAKYLILIAGTLIEMLFGLNFIPGETGMVIAIYIVVLMDRKIAAEEAAKQPAPQEDYRESYA
jgi:hypothetical protein